MGGTANIFCLNFYNLDLGPLDQQCLRCATLPTSKRTQNHGITAVSSLDPIILPVGFTVVFFYACTDHLMYMLG